MSTILTMQLSDIRIDGGTQPRERLCEDTVADYSEAMKAGDQFPPIVVFCDGSDNWLADGFHRFHAACKAGIAELPADVRTGTRQDALWHAIGANKANGQRPSRGDVRHAVELALRTWPRKTQREIAAQVGCSLGSVATIKGQLFSREQLPDAPATVTGKDGKVYPTSKPRKQAVDVSAEEVVRTEEPMTPAQNKAFREQAFNAATPQSRNRQRPDHSPQSPRCPHPQPTPRVLALWGSSL